MILRRLWEIFCWPSNIQPLSNDRVLNAGACRSIKKTEMKRKKQLTVADIPHVGPATPAGEWFRRYWLAVGTTRELYDIPQAVKVLGEDLVLFRDPNGQLGCPVVGERTDTGTSGEQTLPGRCAVATQRCGCADTGDDHGVMGRIHWILLSTG